MLILVERASGVDAEQPAAVVVSPPPDRARWYRALAPLSVLATVAIVVWPASALSWILPLLALGATFAVIARHERRWTTRVEASGIHRSAAGCDEWTPWSAIARLREDRAGLRFDLRSGGSLLLGWAQKPDVRAILALAPPTMEYDRSAGVRAASRGDLRWNAALVVALVVFWFVVGWLRGER